MYLIAYGVDRARRALIVKPGTLLGVGLLTALISGIPAAVRDEPYLTAQWALEPFAVGTPVTTRNTPMSNSTGVMLMMIFSLAEES